MSQTPPTPDQMGLPGFSQSRRNQSLMLRQGRSFSGQERNCCFLNMAGGRFGNISAVSGLDFPDDGRAVSVVDWDQDGDLDLWVSNRNAPRLRLLRNEGGTGNNFLALRLQGNGSTTNRDAIGARVEVVLARDGADKPRLHKTLRAGEGFLAQSSKRIHFGLGQAERIEHVIVHWPGGFSETFGGLEPAECYELIQGRGVAQLVTRREAVMKLEPSLQNPAPPSSQARVRLVTLLPMVPIRYQDVDSGESREVPIGDGRPVLVNLWASWCPPCIAELTQLSERRAAIQDAGIRVFALCVDGLGDAPSDPAAARSLGQAFPFVVGQATPQLLADLQLLHDSLIVMAKPLPLPTSFLMDGSGRLQVIYQGRMSVDGLLEDVSHASRTRGERFRVAAPLAGRMLEGDPFETRLVLAETLNRLRLAGVLASSGRHAEAAHHYRDVLEIVPDSSHAHYGMGDVYLKQGALAQAEAEFAETLRCDLRHAQATFRLALIRQKQGRDREAVDYYQRGLELDPTFVEGANNLAWLLATANDSRIRDGREAVRWALHCAGATNYKQPGILDSLAAAYAEAGHFQRAVTWQTEALRLAAPELTADFRARLELYQSATPYHRAEPTNAQDE